jgi:hypothetical protein
LYSSAALISDSADATILQAEVARAREAVTIVEVARAMVMLAAEASTWEADVAHDGATIRIREAEDWVTVAEREASKRGSYADTKGLMRKITLLDDELVEECRDWETFEREHRACFEKLTLL